MRQKDDHEWSIDSWKTTQLKASSEWASSLFKCSVSEVVWAIQNSCKVIKTDLNKTDNRNLQQIPYRIKISIGLINIVSEFTWTS
jgi:hypothetical protein